MIALRRALPVFVAMFFHSIPEGIAVGVGYGTETHSDSFSGLGFSIALAITEKSWPYLALYAKAISSQITRRCEE